MNFVEVKEVPYTSRSKKGILEERLERFMSMHTKYAKAVYSVDEYTSPTGCKAALSRACRQYGFPVDTKMINGEVYLIRRDI